MADYQYLFEKDPFSEYKVYDACRTFETKAPAYEALLTNWQAAFPESYQPCLALGKDYYAKGWEARGNKFINQTLTDQFAAMRTYLAQSEKHLNTALSINPNLIVGHNLLIGIHNTLGNDAAKERRIQKAIAMFPYSFIIRESAVWAKTPRWGGNYPAMEQIANNAQAYAKVNPKLSALYGYIYYDQARRFSRQKNDKKAAELFNKALSYGDHWLFYNERAELYHYHLQDIAAARADIDRSLQLRPTLGVSHRLQSRIAFADTEYDAAYASLQITESLVPEDPKTQTWRKWASDNLMKRGHQVSKTDIRTAMDFYDRSIAFDNENFEAHYWKGVAEYQERDSQAALADFAMAIRLNPRHFKSYQMIDHILAGRGRWEQIIGYWEQFLALQPDHAGAYLELSGTYFHSQDFDQARIYLEKACDLGSQEACRHLARMKSS